MSKLVLPSVKELREKLDAEVSAFCTDFTQDKQWSYAWKFRWTSPNYIVIARFEKQPILYICNIRHVLPNYVEDLEEIVSSNWWYIKNKIPACLSKSY